MAKSTFDEIRARFDADVERFSNLETGQSATMDAALCLRLVAEVAARTAPHAQDVIDVGCGAGNYTLALLEEFGSEKRLRLAESPTAKCADSHAGDSATRKRPSVNSTLIDLSRP